MADCGLQRHNSPVGKTEVAVAGSEAAKVAWPPDRNSHLAVHADDHFEQGQLTEWRSKPVEVRRRPPYLFGVNANDHLRFLQLPVVVGDVAERSRKRLSRISWPNRRGILLEQQAHNFPPHRASEHSHEFVPQILLLLRHEWRLHSGPGLSGQLPSFSWPKFGSMGDYRAIADCSRATVVRRRNVHNSKRSRCADRRAQRASSRVLREQASGGQG